MSVYYINTNGPDDIAILNGLRWLIQQCKNTEKEGIIATPQKNSLQATLVNFGLSNKSVSDFLKTEILQSGQISLRLLTPQNSIPRYHDGIVLVVHPNERILKTIDNLSNLTNILVIPWNLEECRVWLEKYNATLL